MSVTSPPNDTLLSPDADRASAVRHRIRAVDLLLLSAWCGLASGLLEVGARVICRTIDPTQRLYMVSRHFLWLGPLSSLLFFLGVGVVLAAAAMLLPRALGWIGPRLICACAVLPVLMALGPRDLPRSLGISRDGNRCPVRADFRASHHEFTAKASLELSVHGGFGDLAGELRVRGRSAQTRFASRVVPYRPPARQMFCLVVLDTVRADRLSLYGYERSTTPFLKQLARRGVRFDEARATAPWTLPSHASMFNGHWPREFGDEWASPLAKSFPTLAEYLGDHGYATAGFVANVGYCSQETGLARGFTHYEDYDLEKLAPLRTRDWWNSWPVRFIK